MYWIIHIDLLINICAFYLWKTCGMFTKCCLFVSGILGLYYCYFMTLYMFTTLRYLAILSVSTFLFGHSLHSSIAAHRWYRVLHLKFELWQLFFENKNFLPFILPNYFEYELVWIYCLEICYICSKFMFKIIYFAENEAFTWGTQIAGQFWSSFIHHRILLFSTRHSMSPR